MARTWITKVNNVDTVDAAHVNDLQTYKLNKDELPYVRPEDYGAVGDGVHDDKAAIKAAVAACPTGGMVYISTSGANYYKYDNAANGFSDATTVDRAMTIRIDGTIKQTGYAWQANPAYIFNITADNVVLEGNGTLRGPGSHDDNSGAWANESGLVYVSANNVTIRGLTFKDQPQVSLSFNFSDNLSVSDCTFVGGPLFSGATHTEHFFIFGILSNYAKISNNRFLADSGHAARQGMYTYICHGLVINGNVFNSVHEHAVYLNGDYTTVTGNVSYYNQADSDIDGCSIKVLGSYNTITGNVLHNADKGGIRVGDPGRHCVISNNTIHEFLHPAIMVTNQYVQTVGMDYTVISGNTCTAKSTGDVMNAIHYYADDTERGDPPVSFTPADCRGGKIVNNIIYGGGENYPSILVQHTKPSSYGMKYFDVSGNQIIDSKSDTGIRLEGVHYSRIDGNMIIDLQSTAVTPRGIWIKEPATYNRITNNIVRDDRVGGDTYSYLYIDGAGCTNNTSIGNSGHGASSYNSWCLLTPTRNMVKDNVAEDTGFFVPAVYQAEPPAKTTSTTLTIAELQAGIISGIHTAGATQTYTLPTASDVIAGINFGIDEALEWSVINESLAEADTITVAANTGHLLKGSPVIQSAHANTGGKYGNAATFRTRRLSDDTCVTYRKS